MSDFQVSGNFWVNRLDFVNWFEFYFRASHRALFEKPLHAAGFEAVMNQVPTLTGASALSLRQFVALFCCIYNETNFQSMKEWGGQGWFSQHGYGNKEAGRGLIQLTSAPVYQVILSALGYDYNALSAEELDALFLKPQIYLPATRIYLTHPYLAGKAWAGVAQGNFYGFGMAVSGQSTTYAEKFKQRCETLLQALSQQTLTRSAVLAYKPAAKKILMAAAVAGFLFGGYHFIRYVSNRP